MLRWWWIPRNKFFNIYIHRFLHDDEDCALHDHPWWSCSFILDGDYFEHFQNETLYRGTGSLTFRLPKTAHRISLPRHAGDQPIHAISLFLTGPTMRVWGFHCPKGWVPWDKFVDARDHGAVGGGCP
jgi:hypothetical protein